MTSRTLLKSLLLAIFAMGFVACGVKGPPEPPLVNEASVKRSDPSANTTSDKSTTDQTAAPVIFPTKPATAKKKKSKAGTNSNSNSNSDSDKQGQ